MTKEEVTELIRKHFLPDGIKSEEEEAQNLALIEENCPHPHVMDLIYWPPDGKDLTPEEIADIAFAYDWKANQKILCNDKMKELLNGANLTPAEDDSVVQKYFDDKNRFDLRTKWDKPPETDIAEIAEHNTITLDENAGIEEMLRFAVNFERYLKTVYPNSYFQSYLVLKSRQKPIFTFHHESPNCDWIKDRMVTKSNYPIRKNTF